MGPRLFRTLIEQLKTPYAILHQLEEDTNNHLALPKQVFESVQSKRYILFYEHHIKWMQKHGAKYITYENPQYPDILKHIYDPPPILTYFGEWDPSDQNALAIIGTRHPDNYGKRITRELAQAAVDVNITLVSGLAKGIDSITHYTAVRAKKRTIAVMGTPLDIIYPAENSALARQISENGVVLSEFIVGHKTTPGCFVRRNRVISGLCRGVIVTQAGDTSGALATAYSANEQNREVFAVPGNVLTDHHKGCHRLIKSGAKLVETFEDVLDELPILKAKTATQTNLLLEAVEKHEVNESDKLILACLSRNPLHVDKILEKTQLSHGNLMSALLQLELKGYIQQLPGKFYIRKI
ncbi:MAG: DNA-processing protein DprA [Candidatus Marinimicrobia bacterium]|nr:DNA-processing protein DprA [Candidatus Neomarinimicrobiota bacterium]